LPAVQACAAPVVAASEVADPPFWSGAPHDEPVEAAAAPGGVAGHARRGGWPYRNLHDRPSLSGRCLPAVIVIDVEQAELSSVLDSLGLPRDSRLNVIVVELIGQPHADPGGSSRRDASACTSAACGSCAPAPSRRSRITACPCL